MATATLTGCKSEQKAPAPSEPPKTVATSSAIPSAAPSAPASAAPAASVAVDLPETWEKPIEKGPAFDKTWTAAFSVYRRPGGTNLTLAEAYGYCESAGKSLCSESQYRKACMAEPKLGKLETWTASGDAAADTIAVLGGEDCTSKQLVAPTEKKESRATLCCDRAVGVKTEYKSADFLVATDKLVANYESALKSRSTLELGERYGKKVIFSGKVWDKKDLLALHQKYWKSVPQQWTQFDWCRVTIQKGADAEGKEDNQYQTDCAALFRRGAEVHYALQRIIRGRDETPNSSAIIFIGDPDAPNAPSGIDMKGVIAAGSLDAFLSAAPAGSGSAAAAGSVASAAVSAAPVAEAAPANKEKKVRVGILMVVE